MANTASTWQNVVVTRSTCMWRLLEIMPRKMSTFYCRVSYVTVTRIPSLVLRNTWHYMIIRRQKFGFPKFVLRCSYEAALRKGVTTAYQVSTASYYLVTYKCYKWCIWYCAISFYWVRSNLVSFPIACEFTIDGSTYMKNKMVFIERWSSKEFENGDAIYSTTREQLSNVRYCMYINSWQNMLVLGALTDYLMWATPHVRLCGRPSLPHNFMSNKSRKVLTCTIFVVSGNCQGQYFSIFMTLPNNKITPNLELHDWILAKCDQWQPFSKGPNCSVISTNNLQRRLKQV